ncbi:MAG: hypothetical protein QME57_03810 [Patescibacteria group bacterium]|nr:hypothetical protein [Patescibacteria group bacterium]
MRVFEFHFNPRLKPDLIFDSFCYEPENIYEKRMGNLYLVGVLKNVLPQNLHFLDKLAKIIQKEYYRSIARKPEKALKESLKETNEFLEQIAKKGDVSWLGNLSFAVLSLIPHQKFSGWELNFTKVGDLKIFLLRGEKIIDIDQKLKFEEITPWPLKIFSNIVSGKLAEGDVLLISTIEVTDFFERENLLSEIGKIPYQIFGEGLKKIFDKKREEILKISGVLLAIVLTKEALAGKREFITPKMYPKEFSLREVFSPFFAFFKKIKLPVLLRPKLPGRLKRPEIKLPEIKLLKFPKLPRNLILILALIFFLALGFFISQFQEEKELKERQITLKEIQEKVNRAKSFLILKTPPTEREANLLLKESFEEISQLVKIVSHLPKDFQSQVFSLKDEVSKTLFELNKLETIEEPELFFDFNEVSDTGFVPQKMIFANAQLYFFSPYSQNLFRVNQNAQAEIIEIDQKFNLAAFFDKVVLFFSKPNQLTILKEGQLSQFILQEPYSDFNFDDFASFRGHLYFLDKNSAEIIKYPYLKNFEWGSSQLWLDRKEKKVLKTHSLTVDGSIWLLDKDSNPATTYICRYYTGRLQEKIVLEIFPEPKEIKKIFTSATLPYLYLLEPAQKRIIILDKKGQIIKQFQSQKFDNLLDFAVSQDGKTIYLLNGLKVYKINF